MNTQPTLSPIEAVDQVRSIGANMEFVKMDQTEFQEKLKEALKENLTLSLSVGSSYGYYDRTNLTVHLMFNGETICIEEIELK